MLHDNGHAQDTARNCVRLADRIFEKFCLSPEAKTKRAEGLTPRERARLVAIGAMKPAPPAPPVLNTNRMRSVFSPVPPINGRRISPNMLEALREFFALEAACPTRLPHGTMRRVADKHGVKYSVFNARVNFERTQRMNAAKESAKLRRTA